MKVILNNLSPFFFNSHYLKQNIYIMKPRIALNMRFNYYFNSSLIRYNSTNLNSNFIYSSNLKFIKSLIDPNKFIDSRKIEGPVLDSLFPKNVSPWFITGFTEAEGNFDIQIFHNSKALAQTGIKFRFRISSNYKDIVLLCAIKNYFGKGNISLIRKDTGVVTLEVSSIEFIQNRIIPFFDLYPLKGTKYYDYLK
jgi:hypothetical protein